VNGGAASSLLGSIGFNWDSWTDRSGLQGRDQNPALNMCNGKPCVRDGAIFWMDPTRSSANTERHTNRHRATVGQLTLDDSYIAGAQGCDDACKCEIILQLNAQGRHTHHSDWKESGFRWRRCHFQNAKDIATGSSTPRTCPISCA
jgi:hypothetical protein